MMPLLAVAALAALLAWVRDHRRLRCSCNHPHRLLRPHHERPLVMVAYLALWIAGLGLAVFGSGNRVSAIVALLVIWLDGYRLWVHERDRRRRAARALGRVLVDVHGRLRVAPA